MQVTPSFFSNIKPYLKGETEELNIRLFTVILILILNERQLKSNQFFRRGTTQVRRARRRKIPPDRRRTPDRGEGRAVLQRVRRHGDVRVAVLGQGRLHSRFATLQNANFPIRRWRYWAEEHVAEACPR